MPRQLHIQRYYLFTSDALFTRLPNLSWFQDPCFRCVFYDKCNLATRTRRLWALYVLTQVWWGLLGVVAVQSPFTALVGSLVQRRISALSVWTASTVTPERRADLSPPAMPSGRLSCPALTHTPSIPLGLLFSAFSSRVTALPSCLWCHKTFISVAR